ncbi:hypothetical protein BH09VER1_BH09VER1_43630 [soil metagenome]
MKGSLKYGNPLMGFSAAILLWALTMIAMKADQAFPLLGLWRVTEAHAENGHAAPEGEQMEMEFLPDGTLWVTSISPGKGFLTPVKLKLRYTFVPPDVVTYTFDGKATERQRFHLEGDELSFEHLDYKTKAKLRRIEKTEFTGEVKELTGFPGDK